MPIRKNCCKRHRSIQKPKTTQTLNIADRFNWKSPNLTYRINGMAMADVNNDGLQEVVLADEDQVVILQFNNGSMHQLAVIDNLI